MKDGADKPPHAQCHRNTVGLMLRRAVRSSAFGGQNLPCTTVIVCSTQFCTVLQGGITIHHDSRPSFFVPATQVSLSVSPNFSFIMTSIVITQRRRERLGRVGRFQTTHVQSRQRWVNSLWTGRVEKAAKRLFIVVQNIVLKYCRIYYERSWSEASIGWKPKQTKTNDFPKILLGIFFNTP